MKKIITMNRIPRAELYEALGRNAVTLMQDVHALARPAQLRTMRQFAEEEIIIPDGQYEGRRYRCERQPYAGLYFDEVDSGHWNRFCATGPTQSGKSLTCFVIPTLYHLFEFGENVICGLPDMSMAGDKWREDFLPALMRSRYSELLPAKGGGSRGGKVESIEFRNGATLKFMSGGGGDKSRAGFTARVVVITETDGMDVAGGTSREADKITQIEARTRAYGEMKRVYMECTVSIAEGRTWREYTGGSQAEIWQRCPACQQHVILARDNLTGWQDTETEAAALASACWCCPACAVIWSEDDRLAAARAAVVVHRGQTIDPATGGVTGELPQVKTLGFRWSAQDNMFRDAASVGLEEWKAIQDDDRNKETALRQFTWALPVESDSEAIADVSINNILDCRAERPRGYLPGDTQFLVAAMDVGKHQSWYGVLAVGPQFRCDVIDYGAITTPSNIMGAEAAVVSAMSEFRDICDGGFPLGGEQRKLDGALIDAGWMTEVVYQFAKQQGGWMRPYLGWGQSQDHQGRVYVQPKQINDTTPHIGDGYHLTKVVSGVTRIDGDSDRWKSFLHSRITEPHDSPSRFTLFQTGHRNDHLQLAQHLTAERQVHEFVPKKGEVLKWERVARNNHFFDVFYMCCLAAYAAGARLGETTPRPVVPKSAPDKPRYKQGVRGIRARY